MFWQSIGAGILSLFDWHILVGMVGVAILSILHPLTAGAIMGDGDSGARTGAGCIFWLIGGLLFQAIAVSSFILFCLPGILGNGGFTPPEFILPLLWPVVRAGLSAMVIVLFLSFVPFVGKFVAETPGVPIFLQGIFVLRPLIRDLFFVRTEGSKLPNSVFPTFWNSFGYVVIGLALCWLALLLVTVISEQIKKRRDLMGQYKHEQLVELIIPMLIGPLFGLVPLLMYGRFVGLSIQALQ